MRDIRNKHRDRENVNAFRGLPSFSSVLYPRNERLRPNRFLRRRRETLNQQERNQDVRRQGMADRAVLDGESRDLRVEGET